MKEKLTVRRKGSTVSILITAVFSPLLIIFSLPAFIFSEGSPVYRISSESMIPALIPGDIILTVKAEQLSRGDVVLFSHGREIYIKRIIGLPGENVTLVGKSTMVNGRLIEEPYAFYDNQSAINEQETFQITLKKQDYFLLGDNRNHSLDSRQLGKISKKQIKRKAVFIIYPFSRAGIIR